MDEFVKQLKLYLTFFFFKLMLFWTHPIYNQDYIPNQSQIKFNNYIYLTWVDMLHLIFENE